MKYDSTIRCVAAVTIAVFLLGNVLLTGCAPSGGGSGGGRGERKKMFTLTQMDGLWEGNSLSPSGSHGYSNTTVIPPLPFALSDTLLGTHNYALLRLPVADYDLLLPFVKTYEPYFPQWLKMWQQTGREGLAINLAAGEVSGRTMLQLSGAGMEQPVPVVLFWDGLSERRAGFYTQVLQSFSTLKCEESGGCNP